MNGLDLIRAQPDAEMLLEMLGLQGPEFAPCPGRASWYKKGICRCNACRAAHAAARCRCDDCKAKRAAAERRRRADRKVSQQV